MAATASRTQLLVVLAAGAVLLGVGAADEIMTAVSNRKPQPVSCTELKLRPPPAAWIALSGCRVEYASVAFSERRGRLSRLLGNHGRINEIFFPLVDPGETPKTVRIVVSSDEASALAAVQAVVDQQSRSAGARLETLLTLAEPLEQAPVEGLLRRRLFGSARPDAVRKLGVPLAADFEILDLGARPSATRSTQLAIGALICGGLFLFVLSRKPSAARSAREIVGTYKQAPTAVRLSGLMLLNLPPDATPAAVETAPPLGSREQVTALIRELLPGAVVEESGRVSFSRADYSVEIDLGTEDPVGTATVTLSGQASIVAMRRLLRRTGWRLFAAKRGEFIGAEVLGSLLAESGASGPPEALVVPAAPPPAPEPWAGTARSGRHYSRHVVGLAVLIGVVATLGWYTRTDWVEANEALTIEELAMLGAANLSLRVATGAYAAPEQLANPENASRLGASALPESFGNSVRHGYRFEFRGEPLTDADRANVFPVVDPGYRSFVYVAGPVAPDITGRRWFAYYSEQTAVYSHLHAVPTPKDTPVATRP